MCPHAEPKLVWPAGQPTHRLTKQQTKQSTNQLHANLTVPLLVKKFPTFYGSWRFSTMFTATHHCPHSQPDNSSPVLPSYFPNDLSTSETLYHILQHVYFIQWGSVRHLPDIQVRQPPYVNCLWLLIKYIHSYDAYLKPVTSIHKPKMCHAVVTHQNTQLMKYTKQYFCS